MTDERYVADFIVRPGIWDDETKIAEIGQKRHTAIFPEQDGESTTVTFCNNCGCPFTCDGKCVVCGF